MNCILDMGGFKKLIVMPSMSQFIYVMDPTNPESKYSTLPYSEVSDKLTIDVWVFRIKDVINEIAFYEFYERKQK